VPDSRSDLDYETELGQQSSPSCAPEPDEPRRDPELPDFIRRLRIAAIASAIALPLPFLLQAPPVARAQWEDIDLGGLPEIRSQNGVLNAVMEATAKTVTIGNASFPGYVYNDSYPGPVLRVHPGDFVHIKLINHLPEATNLHFHGLRVTPEGHGDNIHIVVPPGTSFDYAFRIPDTHPAGLFWYHDHLHGQTEPHVNAGLGGALLIEGFPKGFGGLHDVPEKLLVMKDVELPGCKDTILKTQLHCRVISVNGRTDWNTSLAPGGSQLWRLCNQGANLWVHLAIPGVSLRIIGRDGTPAEHVSEAGTIDIMPASRMDVLVTANGAGTFPMLAKNVLTGSGKTMKLNRQVATITVAGPAAQGTAAAISFPPQRDLRDGPVSLHRTVTFTEESETNRFFIDGKMYDHNRIDARAALGTVEEWTVRNQTHDFHEFHIHQLGFQVIEINGKKQDFDGYLDDVNVPDMGEVKLLIPFTDPGIVGHFVYHCHVLKHEDHGMMANIEVYRQSASIWQHICRFAEAGQTVTR
jgi:FtsP/CotA-like multicopper oxidase with cupredoxin domain